MLKKKKYIYAKKNKSKKNQNGFKYDCKHDSRRCGSYRMYLESDSPHQVVMIMCECIWFSHILNRHNTSVEKENSRPIISWHVTLSSPQNTANYKASRIAARFCYHYLETNKNFPNVMQKNNHTSMRVSDDISSPARVSDNTSNLKRVSDDIDKLIRLWHVSPIKLRHMSLTHPQTPINRSLPKAFGEILRRSGRRS